MQVARLGGFTAASAAMKVSNATVTTLVQQLEGHLGVGLFHRTTRKVTLTTDGRAALERVERLLQDLRDLQDAVRGTTKAAKGRVRVDVPAAFGRHVLAPVLPDFFQKYPGIELQLGSSDRPVELVREGVDCVVRGGPVFDEQLVAKKLRSMEVVTCASPSYLKKHGTPTTLEELSTHRAVNFFSARTGEVYALDFQRGGESVEIPMRHAVACNDSDTFLACAVAGLGLVQTPLSPHVKELLREKKLTRVLSEWESGVLPMYILYPPTRHLNARVRAFVDWLLAQFGVAS